MARWCKIVWQLSFPSSGLNLSLRVSSPGAMMAWLAKGSSKPDASPLDANVNVRGIHHLLDGTAGNDYGQTLAKQYGASSRFLIRGNNIKLD